MNKLLKKFRELCFDTILSNKKKNEEKNTVENFKQNLKNIKMQFFIDFKDSIDNLKDREKFDEEINDFLNALKDTDGIRDKIENLKKVLLKINN